MSLHDDIVNIQRAVQKQLSAAAELAVEADAEVAEFVADAPYLEAALRASYNAGQ